MNELQIFWATSDDDELKLNLALTYLTKLADSVGGEFDAKLTMEDNRIFKVIVKEEK